MFYPSSQRHASEYTPPPWIRQLAQSRAAVEVQLRPEELAALQRVADRVAAGDYRLDRASELTLRLLAYKWAVERGLYSDA